MIIDDRADSKQTISSATSSILAQTMPSNRSTLHIPHRFIFMAGGMCGLGIASIIGAVTLLVLRFQQ